MLKNFFLGLVFFLSSFSFLAVADIPQRIVVVGASAASLGFLQTLAQNNFQGEVIWVEAQMFRPYKKTKIECTLSNSCEGEGIFIDSTIPLNTKKFFGRRLIAINSKIKEVVLDDTKTFTYDFLFLGIGTKTSLPEWAMKYFRQGVWSFSSLQDAVEIKKYMEDHDVQRVSIVGAGSTGVELATKFHQLGKEVDLIQRGERILPHLISPEGSKFLRKRNQFELNFFLQRFVEKVTLMTKGHFQLQLDNSEILSTDLVIWTGGRLGVEENILLTSQLRSQNGYILCNQKMQTSDPFIYAAGDATITIFGPNLLWRTAWIQGEVAAKNILGIKTFYQLKINPPLLKTRLLNHDILAFSSALYPSDSKIFENEFEFMQKMNDRFVYIGEKRLKKKNEIKKMIKENYTDAGSLFK